MRSCRIWLLVFQEIEYGSMDSVMYLPLSDPNPVGELVVPQRKCLAGVSIIDDLNAILYVEVLPLER